jgi:DNA polymerase (family 10)
VTTAAADVLDRPPKPRAARRSLENIDVARMFDEVADLLELQGGNAFRIRAYRTAARTLESLPVPAVSLARKGTLHDLPGIGDDLAGKICTILDTGSLPLLAELTAKTPEALVQLLRIPGLGPKRAVQIHEQLGITTIDELEAAARAGRLRAIRGVKETLERRILEGIAEIRGRAGRWRLVDAEAYVRPLVAHLERAPGVRRVDVAGSLRRRRETVGDVDILVQAAKPQAASRQFVEYARVAQVVASGSTRSSVILDCGLHVDLRVVPAVCYGAALHYFTGSKPHNIAIRTLGVRRGLKISEYGIFRGSRRLGGREEREVFEAVGLPWIPPELREARGEIEAAREGRLPRLVERADIRGDLQIHTTYTDGKSPLGDMIEACRALGYEYVAVTDHTRAVRVAGGLTRAGFLREMREIDRLRKQAGSMTILEGAEVDILEDGSLDLDDRTLAELDLVVAAVHSKLDLPRAAMTARVLKALRHPRVHVLAHPTGRLIGRREPCAVDIEAVVRAAADHGVMLEVNAQPDRLDLDDVHVRLAREAGVKLVISTDAHRVEELGFMRHGVDQARRGWCAADDVANTRPLAAFRALLRR